MAKDLSEESDLSIDGKELKLLYQSIKQGYQATEAMVAKNDDPEKQEALDNTLENMEELGDKMESLLTDYGIDPSELGGQMQIPKFLKRMIGGL